MAVLNFKNKKLAFAIAKPIEYLMPKMCLFVKLFGGGVCGGAAAASKFCTKVYLCEN